MAGEGVGMDTTLVPTTTSTRERILNPQDVTSNSNYEESEVALGLDVEAVGEHEVSAKPNFRITAQDAVTVSIDGGLPMVTPPASGDYPLSLISWYSEPATTEVFHSCCAKGYSDLRDQVIPASPFSCEESDRSDEKENKTPPPKASTNPVKADKKCLKMKLETGESNRSRRLDRKCDKGAERSRSVGSAHSRKLSTDHDPKSLECPRCSRKTHSGTTTPATVTGRVPKRQLVKKDTRPTVSRKPIKSILKHEFRGGSSGSEKQSSMDSLGSNGGPMVTSDVGPRLHTKFAAELELNGRVWTDADFAGLKRIERYATLRVRRPQTKFAMGTTQVATAQDQAASRKLSFENLEPRAGSELMTKSMTQAKTDLEKEFGPGTFQRSGSLRGRRVVAAVVQPCATRTSALRLLKMQEKKGIAFGSGVSGTPQEKGTLSSSHSDNGDGPNIQSYTSKQSTGKVFSKLSSAFTASSAQKRQRQDRSIQTEPIMILKKPEVNGHNVISRSPTPMSPEEPPAAAENRPEALDPGVEVLLLRQQLQKYKAKVIKYEYIYNAAEHENVVLGNQLKEVEKEAKEMINFLQDEKLMLAESLAEAETEKQGLISKLEVQGKLVQKLEGKLNLGRSQVKEAQQDVASYTDVLESESLKTKTLQDEVASLRKRFEKMNEQEEQVQV